MWVMPRKLKPEPITAPFSLIFWLTLVPCKPSKQEDPTSMEPSALWSLDLIPWFTCKVLDGCVCMCVLGYFLQGVVREANRRTTHFQASYFDYAP